MLVLNIQSMITQSEKEYGSIYLKILYIVSVVLIITVYSVIKERLSKKNVPKTKNMIIRYTFVIILTFAIKIAIGLYVDPKQLLNYALLYAAFSMVNAFVLKKIIYNISKSDVLSALGFTLYMFLPSVSKSAEETIITYILVLVLLLIIMFVQEVIDELKQIGIKNKKYLVLSLICGVFITMSMYLQVNVLIWLAAVFITLICTSNLDRTHINFPNKFINMLRQKSKELLYRFERIYINKVIIVLCIITVEVTALYFGIKFLTNNGEIFKVNTIIGSITNNVAKSFDYLKSADVNSVINNINILVFNSKFYSLLLIIYIIFIEILNVILRRKYDTKSTIIKAMFVLLIIGYGVFGLNYVCYTQIMQVLLILISIINTTNLYLNRDERIKLLNA
ncbi:MAG: hypothetical protein IJ809_03215 [Clostridia bacterium]|nr:hypothetical protein [Clostridia bacterium]